MEQINLVNEIDLTDFIESFVYDSLPPVQERMVDTGRGFAQKAEVFSARDFLNRDAVARNGDAVAQTMVKTYVNMAVRSYFNQFKDTEFLKRAELNGSESDYVKELAATGVVFYKFDATEFPDKIKQNLQRLVEFLINKSKEYIVRQVKQEGDFVFDRRVLTKDFPDFEKAIKLSKFSVRIDSNYNPFENQNRSAPIVKDNQHE